ncbi:L,D-transpeptidase family protein [Roseicyclus sp. F158]|uniref:L,D-transpeptidase family protein n=1 Tax=Tropicimonas omnivorans TaxID=3075590 RepID=A0ABU3DD81_9RHOB|nr:L,D-transpeptidase family protein [Roseicyclus sp. F158]MDT0681508.1 L,D-transpeptidase family protein [Roseicyclus sp. F158]
MIFTRRSMLLAGTAALLAGCADKFRTYNGPEVTRVQLYKSQRKLVLWHYDKPLRTYDVGLGFRPVGHKVYEGDGRTPEGAYTIDKRNPNSAFHLSIGISYPNERDVEVARALNRSPGGDIFIHGGPRKGRDPENVRDWTAGCIAVSDKQMEHIYAMVRDGTPIDIFP